LSNGRAAGPQPSIGPIQTRDPFAETAPPDTIRKNEIEPRAKLWQYTTHQLVFANIFELTNAWCTLTNGNMEK